MTEDEYREVIRVARLDATRELHDVLLALRCRVLRRDAFGMDSIDREDHAREVWAMWALRQYGGAGLGMVLDPRAASRIFLGSMA